MRPSAASAASRSPSVPAPANSASTFRSFSRSRASPAIAAPMCGGRSDHRRGHGSNDCVDGVVRIANEPDCNRDRDEERIRCSCRGFTSPRRGALEARSASGQGVRVARFATPSPNGEREQDPESAAPLFLPIHFRSALGVADEGADDALLAAVLVALLECGVLCRAEACGGGKAVGTAEIAAADREGGATTPHRGHHLAVVADALLQRGAARLLLAREVVGKAVGTAVANRERAGSLRRGRRKCNQARREHGGPSQTSHWKPLPRGTPKTYPATVSTW